MFHSKSAKCITGVPSKPDMGYRVHPAKPFRFVSESTPRNRLLKFPASNIDMERLVRVVKWNLDQTYFRYVPPHIQHFWYVLTEVETVSNVCQRQNSSASC